jgi:hypothetical protein
MGRVQSSGRVVCGCIDKHVAASAQVMLHRHASGTAEPLLLLIFHPCIIHLLLTLFAHQYLLSMALAHCHLLPPLCCCCCCCCCSRLHVIAAAAAAAVSTSFSAFGIFDGHGGKPAATFASKELLPMVMRLVDRCIEGSSSSSGPSRQASVAAAAGAADGVDEVAGDEAWGVEVTDADRAVWAAQEALVDRLPKVSF